MAGGSESDYRDVVFEREGKEPLHGFMRVDRGMVIVSGYGRHKERRLGSSPPELIARLLLSKLENATRGQADQKRNHQKRMEAERLASGPREIRQEGSGIPALSRLESELNPSPFLQAPVRARRARIRASRRTSTPAVPRS